MKAQLKHSKLLESESGFQEKRVYHAKLRGLPLPQPSSPSVPSLQSGVGVRGGKKRE